MWLAEVSIGVAAKTRRMQQEVVVTMRPDGRCSAPMPEHLE